MSECVDGRVSLAWRDLSYIPNQLVEVWASQSIRELDLSHNRISDLMPLVSLTQLEVLILDDNRVTSHTKIPPFPRLHTLWLNKNRIDNLTLFVDRLVGSCPNLRVLSLLFNEACPYLTGTLRQYKDYRLYIIHRLRNLVHLDDTPVSPEERQEADRRYASLEESKAFAEQERKMLEEKMKRLEEEKRRKQEEEAARKLAEEKARRRQKRRARAEKLSTPDLATEKASSPASIPSKPAAAELSESLPVPPTPPSPTEVEVEGQSPPPPPVAAADQEAKIDEPRSTADIVNQIASEADNSDGPSARAMADIAKQIAALRLSKQSVKQQKADSRSVPSPPSTPNNEEEEKSTEEVSHTTVNTEEGTDLPLPEPTTASKGSTSDAQPIRLPPPPPVAARVGDNDDDEWTDDDDNDWDPDND